MAGFTTLLRSSPTLDPDKRVDYSLGLVLGVDEFHQEQYYFLERDRQHNRALHGYGTVCGLDVTTEGTRVIVSAGLALNPRGKVIRVPCDQCADVDEWLSVAANRTTVAVAPGSPVGTTSLYVVLCYRECETDQVPIAGAPCRSEDETLAPSRVTETFELRLSAEPPPAHEETAVRAFGDLLRRIDVTPLVGPGEALTAESLVELVRALRPSAPASAAPSPGSPASAALRVHPDDAAGVLRAGFRVWVSEVRPALLADDCGCDGVSASDCVLLAELTFGLTPDGRVAMPADPGAAPLAVRPDERPFLVHTRLLQEWLLRSWGELGALVVGSPIGSPVGSPVTAPPVVLSGDATGPAAATRVAAIRGVDVAPTAPALGEVLTAVDDGAGGVRWQPAAPPATPFPELAGDAAGPIGASRVIGLRAIPLADAAPGEGQILRAQSAEDGVLRWHPTDLPAAVTPALDGDVTGPLDASRVSRLQDTPLDASTPADGQVLRAGRDSDGIVRWHAAEPSPTPVPDLAGDVTGAIATNRVAGIQATPVDAAAPTGGQVLRAQRDADGVVRWRPEDPPATPIPGLAGDVTGAVGANRVVGLRATPVVDAAPGTGQFLGARRDPDGVVRWRPADPPAASVPSLNGDVTGAIGASRVIGLQTTSLSDLRPAAGQVLQAIRPRPESTDVQWQPASPSFVEYRPELASYTVVAAGIVRGDGSGRPPVYARLEARTIAPSKMLIRFPEYKRPDEQSMYIVKVLPVSVRRTAEQAVLPVVTFDEFRDDGILLDVRDAWSPGKAVENNVMRQLELMIEVCQYVVNG